MPPGSASCLVSPPSLMEAGKEPEHVFNGFDMTAVSKVMHFLDWKLVSWSILSTQCHAPPPHVRSAQCHAPPPHVRSAQCHAPPQHVRSAQCHAPPPHVRLCMCLTPQLVLCQSIQLGFAMGLWSLWQPHVQVHDEAKPAMSIIGALRNLARGHRSIRKYLRAQVGHHVCPH